VRFAYDLADYQVVGMTRDSAVGPSNFFELDVRLAGVDIPSMEEARLVLRGLSRTRMNRKGVPLN